MLKIKDTTTITEILFNKVFLDIDPNDIDDDIQPSKIILFIKDTTYENDENKNNISLIIINKENGYVINNSFKFKYLVDHPNRISFYLSRSNKLDECVYYKNS